MKEFIGNVGGKPSEGVCGLPKIDGAVAPTIANPGNPFMLKDGGKFPKFGGGSCDILAAKSSC